MNILSVRSQIAGSSDLEVIITEGIDVLDKPFPEGGRSEQNRSVIILESPCKDLGARCGPSIDQDCDRCVRGDERLSLGPVLQRTSGEFRFHDQHRLIG